MRITTAILSVLMVLLGLTMIAVAIGRGGGPLAFGVLVGALFIAAGALRLWAERRS